MGDGATDQLRRHIMGGMPMPKSPVRKRDRARCCLCGNVYAGVRGVMDHQNQKHGTNWSRLIILDDRDPSPDVYRGYAELVES